MHTQSPQLPRDATTGNAWLPYSSGKAQHALSIFANLRADARDGSSSTSHVAAAADASAAHAKQQRRRPSLSTTSTAAHSLSTTPHKRRHNAAHRRSISRSVQSSDKAEDAPGRPLSYTDAELNSMTTDQLRRQLRVSSAVAQRLHRRNQQLQREVAVLQGNRNALEGGEAAWSQPKHTEVQLLSPGTDRMGEDNTAPPPPSQSTTSTDTTGRPEDRAAALEKAVLRLTEHKERLTEQLYAAEHTITTLESAVETAKADAAAASVTTSRNVNTSTTEGKRDSAEEDVAVTHLRDTIRELERRLKVAEARVQQAAQVQLDALLQHGEGRGAPSVVLVNAEVQRLFRLMQQQLVMDAAQHQAERARMNELLYRLERRRGMM